MSLCLAPRAFAWLGFLYAGSRFWFHKAEVGGARSGELEDEVMPSGETRESLRKFAQVMDALDVEKRISAAKWLEGVVVAQSLTAAERDRLVAASNEYIGSTSEAEYADAVNAFIDYLWRVQRESKRALKKRERTQAAKPVAAV